MRGREAGGLDELREIWRRGDDPVSPPAIRRAVRRQQWRLAGVVLGELAVTVIVVAATLWRIDRGLDGFWWTWLAVLWASWLAALGFTAWNRRGVWRADGRSTRAYLALLLERARRRQRTARFVLVLLGCEAAAVACLLVRGGVRGTARGGAWVLLAAICAVYAAWALNYGSRARREQRRLSELQRVWQEDGPAAGADREGEP